MPPTKGKNPNPSGLGRAIINRQAKDAHRTSQTGLYTTDIDSTTRLQSITQERDLDEFLNTAQLAGTQFTAERRNVTIINSPATSQHNAYLLSDEEETNTLQKHRENRQRLRVPRRPPWTKDMAPAQLDRQEKDAFLEWRRGLAELQDRDRFLLTPFERNVEVWRQLWRVLERSHLVVQIVDARNPLRFRCEDLESYVQDVEGAEGEAGTGRGKRRSLLLINKADLLTLKQRRQWADYFDTQGINYAFFSAANAAALQEARRQALAATELEAPIEDSGDEDDEVHETGRYLPSAIPEVAPGNTDVDGSESSESVDGAPSDDDSISDASSDASSLYRLPPEEESEDARDPRVKVLSVLELEDLFVQTAPDLSTFTDSSGNRPSRLVVGLVGYPNVGKSSTINALLGEKKVSVSSTPGKTKHFQTINLSPSLMLCDCPGLVFPQFTTTKADLVCDGVLPIDQMREHTGPVGLVVKRIPKEVLDATYGLNVQVKTVEEGGSGQITPEDFLVAHAIGRGFMRSGQGNPDEARAARYIMKDYVNAKLLYCHPPPGVSEDEFNEETRQIALGRAMGKKRAPTTRVAKGADTFVPQNGLTSNPDTPSAVDVGPSFKSQTVDRAFFASNSSLSMRPHVQGSARHGQEVSRMQVYPHQNAVADDGSALSGRRARIAAVLVNADGESALNGKKHHKRPKRVKQRSGRGYD
ncbi:P-loop containing nucleoside triphosphate hydrolase protein [Fomitopsis serialis]|uniref:P-loop containing nucleoside triphosphate hydrolase protein n=1 Tax=Fomitopsis serialis TaxID=139415 RepID=UPI002007ECE7|nr:P-loop containing nucleoside triphosphate hydrolase protein [Neoantrodia serialis]KAH9937242.1 P-loop containing nucleoside triphosphate hydrolase protein [Neoantrodia serialis]